MKNPAEILGKFRPEQIRDVMTYLGSDKSARDKMLNNGSITAEEAKILDNITDELKCKILKKIFDVLQGDNEVAA